MRPGKRRRGRWLILEVRHDCTSIAFDYRSRRPHGPLARMVLRCAEEGRRPTLSARDFKDREIRPRRSVELVPPVQGRTIRHEPCSQPSVRAVSSRAVDYVNRATLPAAVLPPVTRALRGSGRTARMLKDAVEKCRRAEISASISTRCRSSPSHGSLVAQGGGARAPSDVSPTRPPMRSQPAQIVRETGQRKGYLGWALRT